jgi:hypothetical protein
VVTLLPDKVQREKEGNEMPRAITLFVSLVLLLGLTSGAQAIIYNYTFTGSDSHGTASATMVLDVTGNSLSMILENTSTTASGNYPSIVAIQLWDGPGVSVNRWSLGASQLQGDSLSNFVLSPPEYDRWRRDGGRFFTTNAQWGMFNPASAGVLPDYLFNYTDDGNFFTRATMLVLFNQSMEAFTFNPVVTMGFAGYPMPTLSLSGQGGPAASVPEPGTILLLGAGLLGLAAVRKRK